jgi:hypothetical protein
LTGRVQKLIIGEQVKRGEARFCRASSLYAEGDSDDREHATVAQSDGLDLTLHLDEEEKGI